ncbi:MAG: urea ABC transporter permease subunit UrtB [Methylomonas sp.]|uniref:urea ABC transporter permease subunit UrtB n=1 Tax=Methylomonas sp. TaxID=418 RepID=UPI0025E8CDFA|nr:urea ABC transporter permease subunit UrtB [Methylomonas sp.]MCK9604833.1 urea ABC transporter permease subunit UrtB [Methylomonas sp.]
MTTNHAKNDFKTLPLPEHTAGPVRRNGGVFKSLLSLARAAIWALFLLTFSANLAAQTGDDLPQPLEQLRLGSMAEREQAIEQLAEDSRNLKLLQALQDGQLMDWKAESRLVIASESAKGYNLRDPFDGKAVLADVERDAVGKLNLTNKLRSVLRKAIGGLQLNADSADMRLEAVKAIAKDADDKALQLLRKRLEKERDAAVLAAIQEALWLQDLNGDDKPARLAAITALKNINNQDAYNRLRELAEPDAEADPEVAEQARSAVKKIESRLQNYAAIETVFFGLSLGAVLVLASIGLAITFGVMGVINMAHGELMMLGAYTTYVMQQLLPEYLGTALIISIPMAFLVAALVGVIIERGIIRFLYGRPLETLLATFGVSLFLQQSVRSIFSPLNRSVSTPDWMSGSWQINDFLSLTWNRFYILIFCLLVFTALLQILKRTKLGLEVRAVAQNRGMARAMGIPTARVDAMTFGLGSGIAGVAGVALSQITNVGPNLGQAYIVDSFMVVVFGGVGNLFGTLVAGFSLGIANKFLEPYAGAVLAKILVLVFIILFIQKKPRGLFPQKGRAADG